MKGYHIPVMLREAIEYLNIKPEGFYIDCTLGEGGHSTEILKHLTSGNLLSLDHDQEAIDFVKEKFPKKDNWEIVKSNFSKLGVVSNGRKPDGILMDLGLSSRQLEGEKRGFSYQEDAQELDMRMDTELGVKALDLLKVLSEKDLTTIFYKYGEERFARKIANQIKKSDIKTVGDLTSLIYRVVPAAAHRGDSHHPAHRVFQALRIAVNDELNSLEKGLDEGFKILNQKGRFVVIAFHSLEDRMVKRFFEEKVKEGKATKITDVIIPSEEEIKLNSRAHSAKLRVIEKI